ncbi:retrovirus-related pol polyprotein from transposon TNT 1-94 [Tanacetum coccineum]
MLHPTTINCQAICSRRQSDIQSRDSGITGEGITDELIVQEEVKVIQNGNSKKRISTGKDGVVRILPPVSPAEIHAVEKERKARTMFTHGYSQGNICEDLRGLVDAKEIWKAIRTRFGGNANLKKMHKAVLKQQQFKRDSFYQDQGARKKEQKQNCLLTMDDGVVNWGEHTVEEEESNHALMAISSSNEVSLCSKTCIDSYNKLKTLCDEQMNQLEDSVGKPLYSRLTKTSDFKGVPHPLSGDYTPTPQEEIDESLYVYGKKGPQEPTPSVSDDRSSEYSTCQSNDSAGSIGTSSEHYVDLEYEISRGFNHANQFVPRPVQLNAGRPNINSVRPNINTGRTNINSVRPNISRTNINSVRSNINTGRTNVNHVSLNGDEKVCWVLANHHTTNGHQFTMLNRHNTSRAKKLEKSHDPLALVAHTGSSSRQTSSYYVTHPTSVVDYDDEYQQDDVHNNSEDPLVSAMLLLAKAITQNFSNPTNNRLRASSNTRNQAIIQGDRVNIQSRNSGNTGRNNRRAYVQEEVVEGMNAQNETGNVQRTLRTPSSGNTSTVQCYNCSGKGHYARNCPKPRVRDSKYFMEQMLLAKQDEAGVILTDEQNDFLFADASRMEEIEELSANICLMARIQPADHTSDDGPSYESAFISEVQSSSIDENNEPMYPTHTKIINSTIGDDQINSNIKFDSFKGNVNSGSVDKDTHVPDLCAVEKLARNAYQEAEKQRIFAKQVQTQNMHLTSQIEMYKDRVRILEGINKDNNYLNEFLEADERAKRYNK